MMMIKLVVGGTLTIISIYASQGLDEEDKNFWEVFDEVVRVILFFRGWRFQTHRANTEEL